MSLVRKIPKPHASSDGAFLRKPTKRKGPPMARRRLSESGTID